MIWILLSLGLINQTLKPPFSLINDQCLHIQIEKNHVFKSYMFKRSESPFVHRQGDIRVLWLLIGCCYPWLEDRRSCWRNSLQCEFWLACFLPVIVHFSPFVDILAALGRPAKQTRKASQPHVHMRPCFSFVRSLFIEVTFTFAFFLL